MEGCELQPVWRLHPSVQPVLGEEGSETAGLRLSRGAPEFTNEVQHFRLEVLRWGGVTSSFPWKIARLSANGSSVRQITAALDRSPSTISRELKRNRGAQVGWNLLWNVPVRHKFCLPPNVLASLCTAAFRLAGHEGAALTR